MTEHAPFAATRPESSPEFVADLLDVVAEGGADDTLNDLDRLVTRLRANVQAAAAARYELRHISADVLREAIRLRAIRAQHLSQRTSEAGSGRPAASGESRGCVEARADVCAEVRTDVPADVPAGVWVRGENAEVDAAGSDQ